MRQKLGYIQESDLDLILVLDARIGGPISRYLLETVDLAADERREGCRSTLRGSDVRETDVEISWPGGVLLVEDKVDAPFQPGQPESYAAEVARRRSAGEQAASVLICPSRRRTELEATAAGHFTAVVTCAELASVVEATGDAFGRAASMVYRAAEQPRPSREMALDPDLSAWGDAYRAVIASVLPAGEELTVGPRSLRAEGREFAVFLRLDGEREVLWTFGHWVPAGQVRMELAPGIRPPAPPDGVRLEQKPQQCWVVVDTAPLDFDVPPAEQSDAIEQAVLGAVALRRWLREIIGPSVCS